MRTVRYQVHQQSSAYRRRQRFVSIPFLHHGPERAIGIEMREIEGNPEGSPDAVSRPEIEFRRGGELPTEYWKSHFDERVSIDEQ